MHAVLDGPDDLQSSRDYHLSWPVVCAAFTTHALQVQPDRPAPVQALGVDEIRRGRPHWVFDEVTGVWRTNADRGRVDLSDSQGCSGRSKVARHNA